MVQKRNHANHNAMEIAFRTKALREVCLNGRMMDERFGAEGAAALKRCIADIRAAACVGDVPFLNLTPSPAKLGHEAEIALDNGLVIVLRANHQRPPTKINGEADWSRVGRILIQRIERHND